VHPRCILGFSDRPTPVNEDHTRYFILPAGDIQ